MNKMAENHPEIIIYEGTDNLAKVEVKLEGETVWLTQLQLAQLYDTTKQNIGQHIKNIITDDELSASATVKKIFTVQAEGARQVEREINDREVEFGGRRWKLSPLAKDLHERIGRQNHSGAYQGPAFFAHNTTKPTDLSDIKV